MGRRGLFSSLQGFGRSGSELFTRLGVCSTFSVFVQGGFGGTKDSGVCACTVGIAELVLGPSGGWPRTVLVQCSLVAPSRKQPLLSYPQGGRQARHRLFSSPCSASFFLFFTVRPLAPWRSPRIPCHVRGEWIAGGLVMGGSRFCFQRPPREVQVGRCAHRVPGPGPSFRRAKTSQSARCRSLRGSRAGLVSSHPGLEATDAFPRLELLEPWVMVTPRPGANAGPLMWLRLSGRSGSPRNGAL